MANSPVLGDRRDSGPTGHLSRTISAQPQATPAKERARKGIRRSMTDVLEGGRFVEEPENIEEVTKLINTPGSITTEKATRRSPMENENRLEGSARLTGTERNSWVWGNGGKLVTAEK